MKTANQYLAAHANMKYALQMYMYKQEILMTKCLYLVLAHLTRSFRVFFFIFLIVFLSLSLLSLFSLILFRVYTPLLMSLN